jgi:uncharacterized membrane protein
MGFDPGGRARLRLYRLALRLPRFVRRHEALSLGLYSAVLLAAAGYTASIRPLWYDEMFTYHVSRLPGPLSIWNALRDGADTHPPLSYWLAHVSLRLFGDTELALRLPSILCYWLASLVLYAFVRRRADAPLALAAALALCATAAYPYAFEARSYAAMLLFAGLALFCWQSIRMGRRRRLSCLGLAASIAAGVYGHYYGVLVVLPLALAEVVATTASRRPEPLVWIAAGLGGAACLPLLGHVRSARGFAGSFWSGSDFSTLPRSYQDLFVDGLPAASAAAVLLLSCMALFGRSGRRCGTERVGEVRSELAACAGFLLLPLGIYLLARFLTKAAYYRYVLSAAIGAAGALSLLVHTCAGRRPLATSLLLAVLCLNCLDTLRTGYKLRDRMGTGSRRDAVAALLRGVDGPVLLGSETYLPVEHYLPAADRSRLFVALDLPARDGEGLPDTGSLALSRLRAVAPIGALDYADALSRFPAFHLYRPDPWFVRRLKADGAEVTVADASASLDDAVFAVRVRRGG